MRHFIALLFLFAAAYFFWQAAPGPMRRKFLNRLRKHGKPLAAFTLILVAGLLIAYFVPSIKAL